MLNHDAIKALFEFNKEYVQIKEVDGIELIYWNSFDICTPKSILFNQLSEINKKRVLFYVPLLMKDILNDLYNDDAEAILDFHKLFEYDESTVLKLLRTLFKRNTISIITIGDNFYNMDFIESIVSNNTKLVSCRYFFLICVLVILYNELESIPKDFIPSYIKDREEIDQEKTNRVIDTLFKDSNLPEVE